MVEGRKTLFGPESRQIARKVMVILSDGSQNYSDSADGPQPSASPPIPNLGFPIPTPYPDHKYVPMKEMAGAIRRQAACPLKPQVMTLCDGVVVL